MFTFSTNKLKFFSKSINFFISSFIADKSDLPSPLGIFKRMSNCELISASFCFNSSICFCKLSSPFLYPSTISFNLPKIKSICSLLFVTFITVCS